LVVKLVVILKFSALKVKKGEKTINIKTKTNTKQMKAFALALLLTSATAVQIGTQAQAEHLIDNVEDVEVDE